MYIFCTNGRAFQVERCALLRYPSAPERSAVIAAAFKPHSVGYVKNDQCVPLRTCYESEQAAERQESCLTLTRAEELPWAAVYDASEPSEAVRPMRESQRKADEKEKEEVARLNRRAGIRPPKVEEPEGMIRERRKARMVRVWERFKRAGLDRFPDVYTEYPPRYTLRDNISGEPEYDENERKKTYTIEELEALADHLEAAQRKAVN